MTAWVYEPSNSQLVQLSADELIRPNHPPLSLRFAAGPDSIFYGAEGQDQDGPFLALGASDGTPEGTHRTDQRMTAGGSFQGLESLGELGVYILDGAVWLRNGDAGNFVPAPLAPGAPDYRLARDLTVVAGRVYFSAVSDEHGRELWLFDGQQLQLTADIYPGPASSTPAELAVFDGVLYFSADDGTHGAELWTVPTGDEAAPQLLRDVVPGPAASRPAEFLKVGDDLLFSAEDGVLGRELWREGVWLPGDADGDGRVGLIDLNRVRNHFGLDSAQRFHGDLDGNGVVDLGDLNAVRNHFGATLASATTGGTSETQRDCAAGSFAKAADLLFMLAASNDNRPLKRSRRLTGH